MAEKWTKTALHKLNKADVRAVANWGGLSMPDDATKNEIIDAILIMGIPWTPVPIPEPAPASLGGPELEYYGTTPEMDNPSVRVQRIRDAAKSSG